MPALKKLLSEREAVGVAESNPYVSPNTEGSSHHIDG